MFLVGYVVVIAISYFVLRWLFELFFLNVWPPWVPRSWAWSVMILAVVEIVILALSYSLQNIELGNRLQHAFGGGLIVVLACYLALRDSRISVTPVQFFVFAGLLTTTLGVGNELLEFTLQSKGLFVFAATVNDTWFDLTSNTVGTLIGASIFALLIHSKQKPNRSPE